MPHVVAIVNPVAGKAQGARLRAKAVDELGRLFPDIAFVESNAPGHATVLAQGAKDAELVIAIGGDGTVREVASGLVGRKPEVTTKAQRHKGFGQIETAKDAKSAKAEQELTTESRSHKEAGAETVARPDSGSDLVSSCLGGKNPELAVIPVGSGNDFLKTVGIPSDVTEACRVAKEGQVRAIDIVRVEMAGEDDTQQAYSINAAGFGFVKRS